jgi:eukaryotic-like serine/threonine-protein kinase
LKEHCADDPALVCEVASLLDHDNPDEFLETPLGFRRPGQLAITNGEDVTPKLPSGSVVGSWELLRRISSGGMGAVYLAERAVDSDQPVKQRAAIEVMRQRG